MKYAVLTLLLPFAAAPAAAAGAAELQDAFAAAAAKAAPAVVAVSGPGNGADAPFGEPEDLLGGFLSAAELPAGPGPTPPAYPRSGSGLIIDPAGYILTNEHVVRGSTSVVVSLADGSRAEAAVIGADQAADLALLKAKTDAPLPFLALSGAARPRAGDWALALGNALGMEGSVTVGVVSAPLRKLKGPDGVRREAIQTDAAINPGNSGGPLLNLKGEVIGINASAYAPSGAYPGIGFAIPAAKAKDFADGLLERAK